MKLNLLVIKTSNTERLKEQYEALGLEFIYHNHGKGPFHYSTQIGEVVFEIYPLPKSSNIADNSTRLGFGVENLEEMIPGLEEKGWVIRSMPRQMDWGYMATVEDFDGRKVELTGG